MSQNVNKTKDDASPHGGASFCRPTSHNPERTEMKKFFVVLTVLACSMGTFSIAARAEDAHAVANKAEKDAKLAQKNLEKEARKAQKEAEKKQREIEKEAKKKQKELEKA